MNPDVESPELGELRELLNSERARLGVHIRKMNSPGSPVYDYWENVVPAAVILFASFGATGFIHFYVGAMVLAVGCWWWLTKVQPKVKDGVFQRTAELALNNEMQFQLLWSRGILTLYAKLPDGAERVATRRDDWREFVRSLRTEVSAS